MFTFIILIFLCHVRFPSYVCIFYVTCQFYVLHSNVLRLVLMLLYYDDEHAIRIRLVTFYTHIYAEFCIS